MFYEPKDGHGLPHNPFKSLIVPRPIGWISTISADGIANLAPFSFFNGVSEAPPAVMFAANGKLDRGRLKDTLTNVEETGEFVVNLVTEVLTDEMNATSAHVDPEVDEFALAGLTATPSQLVKPPRVAQSPAQMECRYLQTVALASSDAEWQNAVVLGEVIGIHIADEALTAEGKVDVALLRPLARLGYMEYTVVEKVFSLDRPA
ncbi:MAG TPA: flavin reductase family protein [Alphaproteobacteria bacterium]|jgi:flavin reductase (DIM6/NTAB) family NADH-FMN oxidoreductase RutF|nr:flavin reductase family protein [Alphaproteobacteria bacterium]MDP7428977.1 flavin reductase family protein [Alphaproteobacteria bacterium]HJM51562.1 flavin reductase family protein [Alphaproteobacteria bacterium]|tara:strand:- start:433 stop:1047 length:615 start_codon:yes stop_codon:yes gene_type:complete